MAGVGLHISQALKGRSKKALEFTQLITAIGACVGSCCLATARGGARVRRRVVTPAARVFSGARRRVQEQG